MPATDATVPTDAEQARSPRSLRFVLREFGGSLGDLGTFVPLTVAMVQIVGLDAATVLVFAGLATLVTGLVFRIPMAVQPMKAIAALAIAGSMTAGQVGMAGLTVGVIVLLMGGFGLVGMLDRILPRPVLRALQLTVGFHLILAGMRMGLVEPGTSVARPLMGPEGYLVVAGGIALMILLRKRLQWMALGLVVLGLAGAAIKHPALLGTWNFTLWSPSLAAFDSSALPGIWLGGLAQAPMTLLNSVFAVSVLAVGLFPGHRERNSPKKIAISVGLINVLTCPFGAMPVCHGSGGLAGQYRFGARTGLSMVFLGSMKIAVGLFFGLVALAWMKAFPTAILSVFLLVAGAALGLASRCWEDPAGLAAAVVMITLHVSTGILLAAFAGGWIAYGVARRIGKGYHSRREAGAEGSNAF